MKRWLITTLCPSRVFLCPLTLLMGGILSLASKLHPISTPPLQNFTKLPYTSLNRPKRFDINSSRLQEPRNETEIGEVLETVKWVYQGLKLEAENRTCKWDWALMGREQEQNFNRVRRCVESPRHHLVFFLPGTVFRIKFGHLGPFEGALHFHTSTHTHRLLIGSVIWELFKILSKINERI